MTAVLRSIALLGCAMVALSSAPDAVRSIAAMPLLFILPGYALALTIVPATADATVRVTWTIALSLAVSVILPLVAGAVGVVVSPVVWTVGLVAVTLAAEVAALRFRRRTARRPSEGVVISGLSATALVVAGAVVAGGFYLSWADAQRRSTPTATQLWMVPGATATELHIGVTRYGATESMRLVVDGGSERKEFPLAPSAQTFEITWQMAGEDSVVHASLYLGDDPSPFREVFHRTDDIPAAGAVPEEPALALSIPSAARDLGPGAHSAPSRPHVDRRGAAASSEDPSAAGWTNAS